MCEEKEHYEGVFANEVGRLCYQCIRRGQEQQRQKMASHFLLSRERILNDSRTFDKEGYGGGGENYFVESERGSGLTVSLMRVAFLE